MSDDRSFGGMLGGLFGPRGMRSMPTAELEARKHAEVVASRTIPERDLARERAGREKPVQLNIRCKRRVMGTLEALAAHQAATKTDIVEMALVELAQRLGITDEQIEAALGEMDKRKGKP